MIRPECSSSQELAGQDLMGREALRNYTGAVEMHSSRDLFFHVLNVG